MRRRFSSLFALSFLAASASLCEAGIPWPANSDWPRHVLLVGTDASGVADPAGTMSFTIRDLGNHPQGSALVVLDFSNTPGIVLCTPQPDPAVIFDCGTRTVRWFVDRLGQATIRLTGRANRSVPGSQAPSANLSVDGVLFGIIPIATPDQDGNGLGAADNSLWQQDYFSGPYWERSDFDGDGSLGAADLSMWTTLYFAGGSTRSCSGSVCP